MQIDLSAFADLIDVSLILTRYAGQDGRWSCHLEACDVMERGMLGGEYGNGKSPQLAMNDYARRIAGKRIAINAISSLPRREYNVPAGLVGEKDQA